MNEDNNKEKEPALSNTTNQESTKEKDGEQVIAEEKCPICLQKFNPKSQSYSSSCFHSFCFECLLEWSKIKHSCPLCKQAFDRIIFEIKSNLDYKEHYMTEEDDDEVMNNRADQPPVQVIAYFPSSHLNSHLEDNTNNIVYKTRSRASWFLNQQQAPVEFRILVYSQQWFANQRQSQFNFKISNIDLEFNNETTNNKQTNTDNCDLNCFGYKAVNKFRIIKPEWFRQNQACMHRLINFISRDLNALNIILKQPYHNSSSYRQITCDYILSLIKKIHLESDEFLNELKRYLRWPSRYIRHFRHELLAFARSTCYDLIEYDAKCVYYSSLVDMPLEEEKKLIVPFKALTVNLDKYKLIAINKLSQNQIIRYEAFNLGQLLTLNNENNNNHYLNDDDNDSDHSSYCEIISPPPKTPPIEITLDDDNNQLSSSACSSKSSIGSNKKANDHEHNVSTSSFDSERSRSPRKISRSRSRSRDRSKRKRTHKKKEKRHHSRSYSSRRKSKKTHHEYEYDFDQATTSKEIDRRLDERSRQRTSSHSDRSRHRHKHHKNDSTKKRKKKSSESQNRSRKHSSRSTSKTRHHKKKKSKKLSKRSSSSSLKKSKKRHHKKSKRKNEDPKEKIDLKNDERIVHLGANSNDGENSLPVEQNDSTVSIDEINKEDRRNFLFKN